MPRPYVPHCSKCRELEIGFSDYSLYNRYFRCKRLDRFLNYQEKKTSPKWCPRRIGYTNYMRGL